MSLEDQIASLRASIEELTSQIKVMTSAAKGANGTKAAKEEEDEKPSRRRASKKDEDDDEKPAKPAKPVKAKKVTVKEILGMAEAFLKVDDDDVYNERRDIVKEIAKRCNAKKLSEIEDQDDLAMAAKLLDQVTRGEDLDEEDEDDRGSSRRKDDDL